MKAVRLLRDTNGATALEFALTAPIFFALLFGLGTIGLALYANVALQHAVERAARCASINTSICGSVAAIKSHAAQESYGLNPPVSIFSVTTPSCGTLVQANYPVTLRTVIFGTKTITLSASSCFPT